MERRDKDENVEISVKNCVDVCTPDYTKISTLVRKFWIQSGTTRRQSVRTEYSFRIGTGCCRKYSIGTDGRVVVKNDHRSIK